MSVAYGYAHRKRREEWRARVERGEVACAYCGLMILPGERWDLSHDPFDRRRYIGPAHEAHNRNTALERRINGSGRGGFRWSSGSW